MHKKPIRFPDNVYIIGAGGVASYLLPVLVKTLASQSKKPPTITLIDGDTLEARNLDRQLFEPEAVGRNKAAAMAGMYLGVAALEEFFHVGTPIEDRSLLIGCVDNHAARRAILTAADQYECRAILAGNEYTDSQAMWYEPTYKDTPLDPRVRYPEILTDDSGDPLRPRGCTGEALVAAPQLAIANFGAAHHAMQLFWFHFAVKPTLDKATATHWPVEHFNNLSKQSTNNQQHYAYAHAA